MNKTLYRDDMHKVIGGVCAGLAEYFGIDVTIVRLVLLLTLILKGGGLVIYVILWIALPRKPFQMQQPVVDYTVPPVTPPQWDPHFAGGLPYKKSSGKLIAGIILVALGAFFLLDDLNIIPDWDFEHLWPVILIALGAIIIFTGGKKRPWEQDNWNKTDGHIKGSSLNDDTTSANPNPPTI